MATKTLSKYKLDDHHIITLVQTTEGIFAQCETCSISAAVAAAVKLMHGHTVRSLTLDGAVLKRI